MCCIDSKNFNNQTIDIHGGGMDLTFPHRKMKIFNILVCIINL
ncbi:hypothetical protein NWQ34_05595 [Mycoplasmopsis felis]|nr:hypothetical protein [Mycoplasmopsis felis]MCU9939030.1 hypothetical protein [Mycoplasmopsis felis]